MGTPGPACIRRLSNDYLMVKKNPPPFVTAHPDPTNLLLWHYTIEGPPGSPYEGGLYHGKLEFPSDFPFNPPSVYMFTPNGRFKTGQRLCFSMSDFHPKEWNPMWSVSSILTGLLSFMLEEHETYGSMRSTHEEKRALAHASKAFNIRNPTWTDLFPEHAEDCRKALASGAHPASPPVNPPATIHGHMSLASHAELLRVILVTLFCVAICYAMLKI
eukprot:TRINITY_DN33594_c0_g1_i1.p1 TRINITY_DN33594_c0_g1~~TRINITY_DN33594_c0_g1_i1.p1  ORF type:complete len:232 (+),score=35.24 TRINITY_DN33594_c0_g1_i1:50-697(+)